MSWLRNIFSVQLFGGGIPFPQRTRINYTGAVTVTDDPVGDQSVITIGGSGQDATFRSLTSSSLTVGNLLLEQQPVVTTTGAETKNLLSSAITIPNGKIVVVRALVKASITSAATLAPFYLGVLGVYSAMGGVATTEETVDTGEQLIASPPFGGAGTSVSVTGAAAAPGTGCVRLQVVTVGLSSFPTVIVSGVGGTTEANGTWAAHVVGDGTHLDLPAVPFVHPYTSGGTMQPLGVAGFSLPSPNTAQIQVTGITPAAWVASETVGALAVREANGNSYMVTRTGAGTTSNTGTGPSGTGTGITNGSATFDYVSAGPGIPIAWQVVRLEIL